MAKCCILVATKLLIKFLSVYQNFMLLSKSHGSTTVLTAHLLV